MKSRCAMMWVGVLAVAAMAMDRVTGDIGRAEADDGMVHAEIVAEAKPGLTVYDRLVVRLTVTPGDGASLSDIDFERAIGIDFLAVGGVRVSELNAGSMIWEGAVVVPAPDDAILYEATLEPLAGGDLAIGPIEIVYATRGIEGDIEHTLKLEALHVTVAGGVEVAEGEAPAGLKDRLDAPQGVPWGWIIGAGGVVAIGAAAIAAVAWRKKQRALPPAPRPAHELAIEALDRLEGEGWLERGQIEPFLARCSDILRRYIGARFGIDAPDRTTEEFLYEATHSRHLSVGHVTLLEGFLTKIDLVKFAKRPATAGEGREAARQARAFVEETALQAEVQVS